MWGVITLARKDNCKTFVRFLDLFYPGLFLPACICLNERNLRLAFQAIQHTFTGAYQVLGKGSELGAWPSWGGTATSDKS